MGVYSSKVKPLARNERCQQTKARNEARKAEHRVRDVLIAEARSKRGDVGQLYQLDKLGLTAKKERAKIQARLDKAKEEKETFKLAPDAQVTAAGKKLLKQKKNKS